MLRRTFSMWIAASAVTLSCGAPPPETTACQQSAAWSSLAEFPLERLDLLVAIDDSPAMDQTALRVAPQLDALIASFLDPPCVSESNPAPHACVPDTDDRLIYPALRDLHVAVVSGDLGSGDTAVAGCTGGSAGSHGDDGLLDPIARGPALISHPPDPSLRADCSANDVPAFVAFDSSVDDSPTPARRAFRCSGTLGSNGCAAQQPLEAMYRAVVAQRADDRSDNVGPNAGFLRSSALLGLLVIGARDDFSVRDCRFAEPGHACEDATDVFDPSATRWAGTDLQSRMDLFHAGSPTDPTWPLDRYMDPTDASRGFLGLKPGHPERIVFSAITGVPIHPPTLGTGDVARADWDALLGAPSSAGADDFVGRDGSTAIDTMSAEGPISMRAANPDPVCAGRMVPACRREGTAYVADPPACTTSAQDFARPARRLVEVARRFAEALCNGSACGNGFVDSVCANDWTGAMLPLVVKLQTRLLCGGWDPQADHVTDASGHSIAVCRVFELQPTGVACDASRLRTPPTDHSYPASVTFQEEQRAVCEIPQVPTDASHRLVSDASGWYWYPQRQTFPCGDGPVRFTRGMDSLEGAIVMLHCVHTMDACGAQPGG